MVSLGNTKLLSIEIGDQCNLAGEHMKCPISIRKHNKEYGALTIEDIIVVIHDAIKLGFRGMVGFQYYNEPMLYIDRIQKVIERVPEVDYLLWTNGTLLDRSIEKNESFLILPEGLLIPASDGAVSSQRFPSHPTCYRYHHTIFPVLCKKKACRFLLHAV